MRSLSERLMLRCDAIRPERMIAARYAPSSSDRSGAPGCIGPRSNCSAAADETLSAIERMTTYKHIMKSKTFLTASATRTNPISTRARASVFAYFLTGTLVTLSVLAQETKPASPPLSREETVLVEITATVQAIDTEKREVTLKGPLGNVVT